VVSTSFHHVPKSYFENGRTSARLLRSCRSPEVKDADCAEAIRNPHRRRKRLARRKKIGPAGPRNLRQHLLNTKRQEIWNTSALKVLGTARMD
jgi:hypothetical protein